MNVARVASMRAGLPVPLPADREPLLRLGLQAHHHAAERIAAGSPT